MAIRWQCKCGQPLQAAENSPERVVTCPKCLRSVGVPQPESEFSPEAKAMLAGRAVEATRRLPQPIKCTYCGWLVHEDRPDCPKCLRKLERPSAWSGLISYAIFFAVLGGAVVFVYPRLKARFSRDPAVAALHDQAQAWVLEEGKRWNRLEAADRDGLQRLLGEPFGRDREWQIDVAVADEEFLGTVDRKTRGRVRYRLTVYEVDRNVAAGKDPRVLVHAVGTLEQRLAFDAKTERWGPDGEPELVDRPAK